MTVPTLPTELVAHVLNQLSKQDLRVASCVCKTWYFLVLPGLYEVVFFKKDDRFKRFVRIIAGNKVLSSPIPASIHILGFHYNLRESVIAPELTALMPYVPHFSHLHTLCWQLCFVPKNLELVTSLQTQCPLLRTVFLIVPSNFKAGSKKGKSRYATLLGFKNLRNFNLEIHCSPSGARDVKLLKPLKRIAVNSPMLKSLVVDFREIPMALEHIVCSLGAEFTLPCLETFHLGGCLDPDLGDTDLPRPLGNAASHFQAFLSRHPRLKELQLNCPFSSEFYESLELDVLAQGLPMLLGFSGPYFIAKQILHYPTARQIRVLTINNWEPDFVDSDEGFTDKIHLPDLSMLIIEVENIPIAMDIMEAVLPAAGGLEDMKLPVMRHNDHNDFLALLAHTPKLETVCLWNYDSYHNDANAPAPSGFNRIELVAAMRDKFPELEIECLGDWY